MIDTSPSSLRIMAIIELRSSYRTIMIQITKKKINKCKHNVTNGTTVH